MPMRFRTDGKYVRKLDLNRRIMPYIMKGKTESSVYFKQTIPVEKSWQFLEIFRNTHGIKVSFFHLVLWAGAQVMNDHPALNRFIAGKRMYQRKGLFITYSAKKEMTSSAPVVALKKEIEPEWDFKTFVENISSSVSDGKSNRQSHTDKELSLLFKLPGFLLSIFAFLIRKLDHFGFLPHAFIKNDPLFSSVFIANLGSIGLDAAYHHLFEYGNIPIFITIGNKQLEPMVNDEGKLDVQEVITLKYTFDERIIDGFYCRKALEQIKDILRAPEDFINA